MTIESPETCGSAVVCSDLFGGSDSHKDTHCETPRWLFESLNAEFGFELDVCANEQNHKCARWYSYRENGLEQEWRGVVWCNPPFDRNKSLWVKKAYEESRKGATVVVLIPYSGTGDAAWFHDYGMKAAELRYVKGRCAYLRPDGSEVVVRTMLLVYRPNHNGTTIAVTYPPNDKMSHRPPKTRTVNMKTESITILQPLPKPEAKGGCAPSGGSTATSELSEIINRSRERGCAEHGHEIKWLLELPMTDEEWKRFNDLTGWSARKR